MNDTEIERICSANKFSKELENLFRFFYEGQKTSFSEGYYIFILNQDHFENDNQLKKEDFISVLNGLYFVGLISPTMGIISLQK